MAGRTLHLNRFLRLFTECQDSCWDNHRTVQSMQNYIPRLKKVRRTGKADKSSGIEMSRVQML